jgi:plasmid stabilization system protein ParE
MANIFMSEEAIRDLERIGDYIAHQFKSPKTALNTILKIKERIDELENFPLIGKPLAAMVAVNTDYRFLGYGSYLAFYRHVNGDVYIDRILHSRQDYVSILLGDFGEGIL